MYIDRRYRPRRRRSPWPIIVLLLPIVAVGIYFLATRTRFFENPFNPLQPTPTPTRSAVSYLAEAEDNYRAGRLAAAGEGYSRVAELEPDNAEALNRLAFLWIQRGRPERAVEIAQRAVAVEESAGNLAILAMALDWDSQYDEAIKIALRAVDKDPLSAEAHAALGEVYADRNNWSRALEEGRQAEKLNPNSAFVQRSLGYILSMQGRYEEALDTYARAAELEPNLGYIYISAGNIYMVLNDYEKAIEQFQKAVVLRPHHACVQIIVPRNKAPVPHRAQQRSVIQPVPEAVFPALPRKKSQQNGIAVLKQPQFARSRRNMGNGMVVNEKIADIFQL